MASVNDHIGPPQTNPESISGVSPLHLPAAHVAGQTALPYPPLFRVAAALSSAPSKLGHSCSLFSLSLCLRG